MPWFSSICPTWFGLSDFTKAIGPTKINIYNKTNSRDHLVELLISHSACLMRHTLGCQPYFCFLYKGYACHSWCIYELTRNQWGRFFDFWLWESGNFMVWYRGVGSPLNGCTIFVWAFDLLALMWFLVKKRHHIEQVDFLKTIQANRWLDS
jgi:hypothetical protein